MNLMKYRQNALPLPKNTGSFFFAFARIFLHKKHSFFYVLEGRLDVLLVSLGFLSYIYKRGLNFPIVKNMRNCQMKSIGSLSFKDA